MVTIALTVALVCALFLFVVMMAIAIINRKRIETLEGWIQSVYLPEIRLGLAARRQIAEKTLEEAEAEGDWEARADARLALADVEVMERLARDVLAYH